MDPLLDAPDVLDATKTKKSKLYADIQAGLYTRPVKIGPRASRWPRSEVAALNAARIAGKSNDEIRALVLQLMAARAALA
ncbi:MAG: transcriptional regulator [Variovorax sp.]|nr:MAG: transcriptional regulator [Variovorax sp.]